MKSVDLCFICNDGFVIPTCTAIMSAILNKDQNTFYNIYIIVVNISEKNRKILQGLSRENGKIHIIEGNMEKFANLHKFKIGGYLSATSEALLKFDLPQLLKNLDKVIYLDGDIIIKGDLAELFEVDVTGNFCAAVRDSGSLYFKTQYNQMCPKYFNSGVMVLNLKYMREKNVTQELIQAKKNSNDSDLMDQNILNLVFKDYVKLLDIKWNFLVVNLERAKKLWSMEALNNMFSSNYKDFNHIKKSAIIYHFSSKDKPWKFYNVPGADLWMKYYKKTPFSNEKLHRIRSVNILSPLEHIFSVRNKNNHIVICMLGLKLKFHKVKLNTLSEYIFSIKNKNDHKVVRILGVKLKLRRAKVKDIQKDVQKLVKERDFIKKSWNK
jgi:lipopolysaccharide biosynthesis glycosyltransferase